MIIGYITQWTHRFIKGFAWREDERGREQVDVTIFRNGQQIGLVAANESHPMSTRLGIAKPVGFTVEMENFGTKHNHDEYHFYVDNVRLALLPKVAIERAQHAKGNPHAPLVYFVHVPKTAGTTFRFLTYGALQPRVIWPNKREVDDNGKRYPEFKEIQHISPARLSNLKLVMGHFNMNMLDQLPVRPHVITFLREPYAQLASYINHRSRQKEDLQTMSLEEIVSSGVILPNPQIRFFLPRKLARQPLNEELFTIAVKNLKDCAVVGLTEYFDESLQRITKKFSWQFPEMERKNKNEKKRFPNIDPDLLKPMLAYDIRFYDVAVELFHSYSE